MMSCDFKTQTYGKWILAGEHAVVRGYSALVFPLREKKLELDYYTSVNHLQVACPDIPTQQLIETAIQEGQKCLGLDEYPLKGFMKIQSNIPIGAGMGASAAVCVAIARWFKSQGFLTSDVLAFAKSLEDYFHGKSSGLDIAGANSETGLFFNQGDLTPLQLHWQPYLTLSYCGQMGLTSQCMKQVHRVWEQNKAHAMALDQQMHEAVLKAKTSLESEGLVGFFGLKEAILEAFDCFSKWGLLSPNLEHHINQLYDLGAMAVKPTGSGNGGYVLSLWNEEPPAFLPFEMIKINFSNSKASALLL